MRYRTVMLAILMLLASSIFIYPRLHSNAAGYSNPEPQQRRRTGQRRRSPAQRRPARDYSKFLHATAQHRALACDQCHTIPTPNWRAARKDEAFPDVTEYPDHPSCVRCHRQQFFSGARPVICTVCHTNVSPRNGNRFAFANPRENAANQIRKPRSETQFAINFPHDKHQDVMALVQPSFQLEGAMGIVKASYQAQEEKKIPNHCTVCHETYPRGKDEKPDAEYMPGKPANIKDKDWPEHGTFKTSPTSHAACFNCHWQAGGVRPVSSKCDGCHQLQKNNRAASILPTNSDAGAEVANAIRDGDLREAMLYRHSIKFRHEDRRHAERGCTSCHINITGLNTLSIEPLDVPLLTCSGSKCHSGSGNYAYITKEVNKRRTAKNDQQQLSAEDATRCTSCHSKKATAPVPPSHDAIVPKPKPK